MYLKWNEQTISDFSDAHIDSVYNQGYLFTRLGKGVMNQIRSLRIDLSKFNLSSENRRILRKTEDVFLEIAPLPYQNYHFGIHKLGKDFYDQKFGDKTFSANKIKDLIMDPEKSSFNSLFIYRKKDDNLAVGFCIGRITENLLHYCYPFYDLKIDLPNLGLGMMLKAIVWARESGEKYVYLGSAQRPTDTYKLQFEGIEWFDGVKWETDIEKLKELLSKS